MSNNFDVVRYTYPSDITKDKYKKRHIKISIKEAFQDALSKQEYEKALEKFDKNAKNAKKVATSLSSTQENLKTNSKSKNYETKFLIVLPIPNSFTDSQSHEWSKDSGVLGTIGKNVMSTSASDIIGSVSKTAGGIAEKIGGGIDADKIIGASSSSMGMRKPLIDPGYFQNYSGSTPRTFDMAWDLIPQSQEEAISIVNIISKLKEFSSPTKTINGVSLLAPYFFSIVVGNKTISSLAKIDRVVLSRISVDYGADGGMSMHWNGMPKYIKLSLTWQEVDMTTAEDYRS
jgi:hypothetical protein